MQQTEIQTEETSLPTENPQRIVRTTKKITEPDVKIERPQRVFEEKKAIFRFNQVIWYIIGIIEVLIGFRFALKVFGADPFVGFTNIIYTLTQPLVSPFQGIVNSGTSGVVIFEWASIIAMIVYMFIAWGLIYLLDLIYPITPDDVSTSQHLNKI